MASLPASAVIANFGANIDKKSLKAISKFFNDQKKGYEKTIADMNKQDKKREKESLKSIDRLRKEYQKMFKEVQKGSNSIDWSNMATGLNSATSLFGKAMSFIENAEKRQQKLVGDASSLDQYSRKTKIDVKTIQLLQNEGEKLGIDNGEIRGFLSSLESARLKMARGEGDDQTATLNRLGVKIGDDLSEIINKTFGSLSQQDDATRDRMLNLLGVSDDLINVFGELTKQGQSFWDTAKRENNTRAIGNKTASEAFRVQNKINKEEDKIDKQFLEGYRGSNGKWVDGTLGSYESTKMTNLAVKNETDKASIEASKTLSDIKAWLVGEGLPLIKDGISSLKDGVDFVKNSFNGLLTAVNDLMQTVKNLKFW